MARLLPLEMFVMVPIDDPDLHIIGVNSSYFFVIIHSETLHELRVIKIMFPIQVNVKL